jgi:hypothetical protein
LTWDVAEVFGGIFFLAHVWAKTDYGRKKADRRAPLINQGGRMWVSIFTGGAGLWRLGRNAGILRFAQNDNAYSIDDNGYSVIPLQ